MQRLRYEVKYSLLELHINHLNSFLFMNIVPPISEHAHLALLRICQTQICLACITELRGYILQHLLNWHRHDFQSYSSVKTPLILK